MGLHHKIIRSVKQAAVCKYLDLDVDIQIDATNPTRVVFRASPPEEAEKAIESFESGQSFPARPLLDVLSELHTEIKGFLYLYRQVSGGKEISDKDRD